MVDKQLAKGVIRGGQLQISIVSDDLTPDLITFSFPNGKTRTKSIAVRWPDDFLIHTDPESGRHVGEIEMACHRHLGGFSRVIGTSAQGSLTYGPMWNLYNLFVMSEEDFEKAYYRIKHRVADSETLAFAMRRILMWYERNESHRCVAAVVYAYKSLDILDSGYMKDALSQLHLQALRMENLANTGHPRSDRTHLAFSMDMAEWHVRLALGDFQGVVDKLEEVAARTRNLPSANALLCFNTCRMLLLLGYLYLVAGKVELARAIFRENFIFYCSGYRSIDENVVWFRELGDAHRAVTLSLQCLSELDRLPVSVRSQIIFDAVNRVRAEAALPELRRRFSQLIRWSRQNGSAAMDGGGP